MRAFPRLAVTNAAVAVLTLSGWFALRSRDQISSTTDILFPFAIGVATYFGGRINGALWLSAPAARLVAQNAGTDSLVSLIECVLVYAFSSVVITREAAAARARDQLRAVLASMDDVVVRLDAQGNYREVADSKGLTRPAGELIGRNLRDVFQPAEAAVFLERISEALKTQSTVKVEYTLLVDGSERSFDAAVSPMHGDEVVWVARDVTDAKAGQGAIHKLNAELEQRIAARTRDLVETIDALHGEVEARIRAIEALIETQERFQLVTRATNDVVWDWDITTNALWMSEMYREHFGGEPPTIDGWKNNIHPEDRNRVFQKLEVALGSDDVKFTTEYRYRRGDGSDATVLDRSYIMRDASGVARRMIGVLVDLSEHRRLAERLEQETRISSLGRIAATIAHEFNNVTMGIQMNLEALRRLSTDPRTHAPLEHAFTAISRSKSITDQILRYTRPALPETRSVSVARLLHDWRDEISAVLPPSVEVVVPAPHPLLRAQVDPLQIAQVLTNLALNAKDAILPQAGRVTVEAFAASEKGSGGEMQAVVHFRISDTGCGMTAEQLSSAFEPLYTTKRHGTGLGLAVSHQIAVQHGGYLRAESTYGRGSTFHLVLPAAAETEADERLPVAQTFSCRRILLVEDDPAVAAGLTTLLESADVEVIVSHDGEGGVSRAFESRPDCLILDVGLPDIDGTEVFDRVRKRFSNVPVIFSSGHADATRLQSYLALDHVGLLIKPYTFAELTTVLSAVSAVRSA